MLVDAAERAGLDDGGLYHAQTAIPIETSRGPDPVHAAVEHFLNCPSDLAIDFLEYCFQSHNGCRLRPQVVDAVNNIFQDEGIGFEFSTFVVEHQQENGTLSTHVHQWPEAIKKSDELVHSTTIMPTFSLLAGPLFRTANTEMMEAHKHLREDEFTAAINSAGQSLETVIKTICDRKRWKYTEDKDTLGKLLQVLEQKKLINNIQREAIQKTSGEIRNKYGAHGKGPNPTYGFATSEIAEHMIQVTSAHILFLVRTVEL